VVQIGPLVAVESEAACLALHLECSSGRRTALHPPCTNTLLTVCCFLSCRHADARRAD
jgi:hypothetical protein